MEAMKQRENGKQDGVYNNMQQYVKIHGLNITEVRDVTNENINNIQSAYTQQNFEKAKKLLGQKGMEEATIQLMKYKIGDKTGHRVVVKTETGKIIDPREYKPYELPELIVRANETQTPEILETTRKGTKENPYELEKVVVTGKKPEAVPVLTSVDMQKLKSPNPNELIPDNPIDVAINTPIFPENTKDKSKTAEVAVNETGKKDDKQKTDEQKATENLLAIKDDSDKIGKKLGIQKKKNQKGEDKTISQDEIQKLAAYYAKRNQEMKEMNKAFGNIIAILKGEYGHKINSELRKEVEKFKQKIKKAEKQAKQNPENQNQINLDLQKALEEIHGSGNQLKKQADEIWKKIQKQKAEKQAKQNQNGQDQNK